MILAILQARASSTRLPGKVLKPILGQPMLFRQIERLQFVKKIDELIVATSIDIFDDPIETLCKEMGISCYRGNLNNVLDRFYQAAKKYGPDHIVRLTGDCPLADPHLIDEVIDFHLRGAFDYTSNCLEPTYPDGLDVEVFRFSCLEEAWREASMPSQLEHVTPFIHKQPDRYKIGGKKNDQDLSELRWTVDEPADFELVTKIYENLYPNNPMFTTQEIIDFLNNNPELKHINIHHERNEGMKKSLVEDGHFIQKETEE